MKTLSPHPVDPPKKYYNGVSVLRELIEELNLSENLSH